MIQPLDPNYPPTESGTRIKMLEIIDKLNEVIKYLNEKEEKKVEEPKRWKPMANEQYYDLDSRFNARANVRGLYFDDMDIPFIFRTREEAEEASELLKKTLKEFHEKNVPPFIPQ